MKRISVISDKNKRSLKIKSIFFKKLINNKLDFTDLTIVIGGDGFMLQTLKKNKKSKQKFYGINSGNYGFLMNKFSQKKLLKNLSKANMITISPLEMLVRNNKNQIKKYIAINEVSILRQSRQAASISISQGRKKLSRNLFLMEH